MPTIGTHNGSFHCDEALGCFLLKQTDAFKNASIVRTRDPAVISTLDVVIDVGGVYDAAANRFDHHQKGFDEVFGMGFGTKLSSAGLVYKHFGRQVVAGMIGAPEGSPSVATVYKQVYKEFIEAVDGIDNGIEQYESSKPPRYQNRTSLSSRVGGLNPPWNVEATSEQVDELFAKAVALTGVEFVDCVRYIADSWLPARSYVEEAIASRLEVDPSGQVLRLSHFCPWKQHLYQLEAELNLPQPVLYVLFEDDRDRKWRIQCVGVTEGGFKNRKSMPKEWRAIRDAELSKVSGIPGCVFVHAAGFVGGNDTYEGVLQMARASLVAPTDD